MEGVAQVVDKMGNSSLPLVIHALSHSALLENVASDPQYPIILPIPNPLASRRNIPVSVNYFGPALDCLTRLPIASRVMVLGVTRR